jgi:polyisoprenoid-binding protein YceI
MALVAAGTLGVPVRRRSRLRALIAVLGLLIAASAPADSVPLRRELWRIDAQHSSVLFHLRALAVIGIDGHIDVVAGEVWRDAEGEWVQVRVPLTQLKMSSERRRRWALSEEFFDAAHHPELKFTAKIPPGTQFSNLRGDLPGTLLLRGVRAPISVRLARTRCVDPPLRCRVVAHGEVSRSRFGMESRSFTLSDTVELDLKLQWLAVKPEESAAP